MRLERSMIPETCSRIVVLKIWWSKVDIKW